MSEDDHLPADRGSFQDAAEAIDLGRVHRLHRVVDDQETERAGGQGRAGQEDAQGQRVDLSLAHDAQRGAGGAVDAHVELDAPLGRRTGQPDRAQVHVALLAEHSPDGTGLLGERGEALVADFVGGTLQPCLGRLDHRYRGHAVITQKRHR